MAPEIHAPRDFADTETHISARHRHMYRHSVKWTDPVEKYIFVTGTLLLTIVTLVLMNGVEGLLGGADGVKVRG